MPFPPPVRRLISALARRAVLRSAAARRLTFRLRWSSTSRLEPLTEWGYERGTPVDRWYNERFLYDHAPLVHGRALEVKEDLYASRLGASRVDVLDIDPDNPLADIVGDLCSPETLPAATYDVAVITQTLQLLPDPAAALANLRRSLRPGGVLLLTAPCMSRSAGVEDRWRWLPLGLQELAHAAGLSGEVVGVGNVLSGRAFLLGAAAEDLGERLLKPVDEAVPLLVTAVLR